MNSSRGVIFPGSYRTGVVSGYGQGLNNFASIHGGTGDDLFLFTAGDASSYGLANDGAIHGDEGDDTILGTARVDSYGIVNSGFIGGDQGNDTITGRAGAGGIGIGIGILNEGTISGGMGNDMVDGLEGGFAGEGTTDLGAGNDTLKGFGTGTFIGGAGRDRVLLGTGAYGVNTSQGTITKDQMVMLISGFETIGGVNGGLFTLRDGLLVVNGAGVGAFL